jgi:hypothetical protein
MARCFAFSAWSASVVVVIVVSVVISGSPPRRFLVMTDVRKSAAERLVQHLYQPP